MRNGIANRVWLRRASSSPTFLAACELPRGPLSHGRAPQGLTRTQPASPTQPQWHATEISRGAIAAAFRRERKNARSSRATDCGARGCSAATCLGGGACGRGGGRQLRGSASCRRSPESPSTRSGGALRAPAPSLGPAIERGAFLERLRSRPPTRSDPRARPCIFTRSVAHACVCFSRACRPVCQPRR